MHELLAEKNWTVEQAALACGVAAGTIQNILNGRVLRPHPRTLHAIAHGFDKPIDQITHHIHQAALARYGEVIRAIEPLSVRTRQSLIRFVRNMEADYRPASKRRRRRQKGSR
jgi:transcriptional regulator with XRE-family HTH domain